MDTTRVSHPFELHIEYYSALNKIAAVSRKLKSDRALASWPAFRYSVKTAMKAYQSALNNLKDLKIVGIGLVDAMIEEHRCSVKKLAKDVDGTLDEKGRRRGLSQDVRTLIKTELDRALQEQGLPNSTDDRSIWKRFPRFSNAVASYIDETKRSAMGQAENIGRSKAEVLKYVREKCKAFAENPIP
ncbi:hypothetical protein MKZ38_010383 [Zalerion maritima]|uniref:Uncharacterized protein n=1 Tax=Zalerion maritima TaxID=339359 RepID=A0AAD5WV49_9PEZI|nr:hypothetical protein MKZ38_010383 [Zalerion maritima]